MSITTQALLKKDLEIRTALISVFDKTYITEFAKFLSSYNVTLIATGGTYTQLLDAGVQVTPISQIAPFPEMLDGRVKTLQPQLLAGVLANKAEPKHMEELITYSLKMIDMVICNFYPFEKVAGKEGATALELVENIDIGGPNMIRAAAKNFGSVCPIPSPNHYLRVEGDMKEYGGKVSYETRLELAKSSFKTVAEYCLAIDVALQLRLGKDQATAPVTRYTLPSKSKA